MIGVKRALTAPALVAVVCAALGTAAAAAPATGGRSRPGGGISGAVSTAAERANREAGHAIVALVPGSYDQQCRIDTDADVADDPLTAPFQSSIEALVSCDTDDDAIKLFATKLTDEGSVDALFDAYTPGGVDPNVPGCESEDTWGNGTGRVKCYVASEGSAGIIWTFPREQVVFAAFASDGDVAGLNDWWESGSAPPLDDAPAPDELVTDRAWSANADALRRAVPKAFRKSCSTSRITEDDLGDLYRDRLALRTVLSCDPSRVDSYFVIDFRYREGARTYLDAFQEIASGQDTETTTRAADCPGTGTWSRGRKGRTVGEYACYSDETGLLLLWSDDRQGIVVTAGRADGDADALIDFYVRDGGPLPST